MKQKFIFDLDGTLLDGNFLKEKEYFESVLTTTDSEIFIPNICSLLEKYEKKFLKYDIDLLSKFLIEETKVQITPDIVKGWIDINKEIDSLIVDGAVELLEHLKSNDKELVVLTNWFTDSQIGRLKKAKIDSYFDYVYGGDIALKPSRDAFINACGSTPIENCIMIGDTYEKDVYGSRMMGLDAIHFDREGITTENNYSVKSLRKIREIY